MLPCCSVDEPAWLDLRAALWPHCSVGDHRDEMTKQIEAPRWLHALIARTDDQAVGMAEAAIRHATVNGTGSSPVLFLEGLYVVPHARRCGVARLLVHVMQAWGRASGCREFASDAALDNLSSHAMHRTLGFVETERVLFFRKVLD